MQSVKRATWFGAIAVAAIWSVGDPSRGEVPLRVAGPTAEPNLASAEAEWAEELPEAALSSTAHGRAGVRLESACGLAIRVDEGRAPWANALRLKLEGAPAGAIALLEVGRLQAAARGASQVEGVSCARLDDGAGRLASSAHEVVRVDLDGNAERLCRGARGPGWAARFVVRLPGGRSAATPIVPLPESGSGTRALPFQRGDIVITEIMKDPSFVTDAHGEWFELQNITGRIVNIAGWTISDLGGNSHTLLNGVQPILLVPGQRFVLGNDADPLTNGGVPVDYRYSNFTLGNGADSILLTSRSQVLVDEVDYDDGIFWPDVPGKALNLHPLSVDVFLNDDPAQWCPAKALIGGGNTDLGTPGLDNDTCP